MDSESAERVRRFFDEFVFGFMYHDIQAAFDANANYLAALGLVAYTEFMGGLIDGTLGEIGNSKKRFYSFWNRMGAEYQSLATQRALVKIYSNVRSGLVHYFIAQDSIVKMTAGDGYGNRCGVEVAEPGGQVVFVVEKYFNDFKAACALYFQELVELRDPPLLKSFDKALGDKWLGTPHIDA